MKLKIATAAIIMAFSINSANAQVHHKAKHQQQRIRQGVKSGALTKAEAKNLHNDQKEIHQEVKNAKADGAVTKDERKDIRQDQKQESKKIFRKKHNAKDRN